MSEETYDELLAKFGTDHEAFAETMSKLEEVHAIGQQLSMVHIERAHDLGIPPSVAMLAMYQIARFQVLCNLRSGRITRGDIRGSKSAMEMLLDLRHPDSEYRVLAINEDGNFERAGTHRQKL